MTDTTDQTPAEQAAIEQPLSLFEQFEQWAELEPDNCRIFPSGDVVVFLSEDLQTVYDVNCTPSFSGPERAVLQAAVQEAIAAHGWLYKIENATDGQHYIQILKPGDNTSFPCQQTEAAIALFRAYLAALKAEPKTP